MHLNQCTLNKVPEKKPTHGKKRKAVQPAPSSSLHDPVRQQESIVAELNKEQDRATEYPSHCLWTRPNRSSHLSALKSKPCLATTPGGPSPAATGNASSSNDDNDDDDAAVAVSSDESGAFTKPCFDVDDDAWEDIDDGDLDDDQVDEMLNSDPSAGLNSDSVDGEETCVDDLLQKWKKIAEEQRASGRSTQWAHYRRRSGRGSKWKEPFRYKEGSLPLHYIAQISLLKILSDHRDNDLTLFDRITEWVYHFTRKDPGVWKRASRNRKSRKSFILFLAKFFKMRDTFPTPVEVTCSSGKVTVPVYDFEQQLLSIIGDPELMADDNLIQSNFDKDTLRPLKSYEELLDSDIIDDVNDGRLYSVGCYEFCDDELKPPDCDMIVPTPLLIYCDEAATDNFGKLSLEPIEFACGFTRREQRAKYGGNRLIGYVPNLDVVSGKNSNNYDDEWTRSKATNDHTKKTKKLKTVGKGSESSSVKKLVDRHACYRAVFKSMMDCVEHGGVRAMWRGKKCLFKPFVLAVIGDTKGYNILCCKYNNSGNRNINSIIKCCHCGFGDLTKTRPRCRRVTVDDVEKAQRDTEYAKQISFHQVKSAWSELPIADLIEGITGVTPFEALHVHGHGTYRDAIEVIHDFLGPGDTNKAAKEEFDLLFKQVAADLLQNAEQRFPLISIAFGIMDLTRVTGMERKGNYLVMIICLHTQRGREIIRSCIEMKIKRKNLKDRREKVSSLLEKAEQMENEARGNKSASQKKQLLRDAEELRQEAKVTMRTRVSTKKTPVSKPKKNKKSDVDNAVDPYRDLVDFNTDMVIETMCMVLAYDEWCQRPKQKWELENAEDAVTRLLRYIKRHLPKFVVIKEDGSRMKGANGYHKVKFHALWTFILYQKKFGCSANYDGGPGESHHKWSVNKTGKQTQRRANTFAAQTATRTSEHALIDYAHKFVRHLCPLDKRNLYVYSTKDREKLLTGVPSGNEKLLGRFELYMTPNQRGGQKKCQHKFQCSHFWDDTRRRLGNLQLSKLLISGIAADSQAPISNWVTKHDLRDIVIEGWTELRVPGTRQGAGSIIYRCCEEYDGFGRARYNWALVLDPSRKLSEDASPWIARLLGFFRYKTPGYPTWKLRDEGYSEADILQQNMTDDTLYVACIGATAETGFVSKDQLDRKIFHPFRMEAKPHVWVLPATAIQMPLAVVRDFGSADRRSFIQVSQQQHWRNVFTGIIEETMTGNGSADDDASVESVEVRESDDESAEEEDYDETEQDASISV